MSQTYTVRNVFGDTVGEYPYTVKGLHDACQQAYYRDQAEQFWEIINLDGVDLDKSSGLNDEEKEYMGSVWGLA